MRISPTRLMPKLMQGLLYTAPILLLTLASCGGGGGTTPTPTFITYTIGGAASGVLATSPTTALVLRNNGGDDLTVASGVTSYTFPTGLTSGAPYNVTVLKNPSSPTQACTVANASGTVSANVTNADVSCVTAYTIGGSITGATLGTGLILQNNGGDNLLVPAGSTNFTFSTPLVYNTSATAYSITVLASPNGQTCTLAGNTTGSVTANVTLPTINCATNTTLPPADPYVYAANYGAASVSTYTSSSGMLTPGTAVTTGSGPSAIAVSPGGKFAFVTNYTSGTLLAYSITSGALSASPISSIATGTNPRAVAIHPSGKFAYVVNQLSNSVSAYSIDASGALASIDADGGTAGTQPTISTRSTPVSIAIDPSGSHAYVANAATNDVSVYSIDSLTGALTASPADGVPGSATYITAHGTTPSSVVVDPNDQYLYVTNRGTSNNISIFSINSTNGALTFTSSMPALTQDYPVSIAIDPTGAYIYVANNGSNTVAFYTASGTGGLYYQTSVATGATPISIAMDSTGQYAYVANSASGDISAYSVVGGTLAQINCAGGISVCNGNNFWAGTTPYSVATSR